MGPTLEPAAFEPEPHNKHCIATQFQDSESSFMPRCSRVLDEAFKVGTYLHVPSWEVCVALPWFQMLECYQRKLGDNSRF